MGYSQVARLFTMILLPENACEDPRLHSRTTGCCQEHYCQSYDIQCCTMASELSGLRTTVDSCSLLASSQRLTSRSHSLIQHNTEIYKLRTTMWNPVVSRSHNPIAVFPFSSAEGSGDIELMLHGTVSYTLNDGRKCEDVEWAARGTLVTAADEVKWKSYQVYMVRTAVSMVSPRGCRSRLRY
jgi:hypothetical protein